MTDWFDELDLEPTSHPVTMGTRSLGDRPWLVADHRADAELSEKRRLLEDRRSEVLHVTDACDAASLELAAMIGASGAEHPLVEAALAVQEDLVLLDRRPSGWHLDSACLCFPSHWVLADKVGRHIAAVHGPVRGYSERIEAKIDRLFDRLTDRPVWRRNWFLKADPALFQPHRNDDGTVPRDQIGAGLWIRSERQTLRRLECGWIVFTIRIQQELLSDLLTDDVRRAAMRRWVADVDPDLGHRRHLWAEQRPELLAWLDRDEEPDHSS